MKYIITHMNDYFISAQYENDVCIALRSYKKKNSNSADIAMGNIYIGRVENVVKNINCAFIEIQKGIKCYYSLDDNKKHIFLRKENDGRVNQGDALLVQVCKEPLKTKSATVTGKVELAGKYLVLSTDVDGVYISSNIKNDACCKSLKDELILYLDRQSNEFANKTNYGFILRSNSIYAQQEDVLNEAKKLINNFYEILRNGIYGKFCTCLYQSVPSYIREIQDISNEYLEEIITDDMQVAELLKQSLTGKDMEKVRWYQDDILPLYKLYDIEKQLKKALSPKVWLKCGGFIVIQQTEALVSIDVNSAKCVSKKRGEQALEDTYFKVNMEAAAEIAIQLRLRNISGIIIVDFINMKEKEHYNQLIAALKEYFKKDKIMTTFVDITRLGLVEITRKRVGKTLKEVYEDYRIE